MYSFNRFVGKTPSRVGKAANLNESLETNFKMTSKEPLHVTMLSRHRTADWSTSLLNFINQASSSRDIVCTVLTDLSGKLRAESEKQRI